MKRGVAAWGKKKRVWGKRRGSHCTPHTTSNRCRPGHLAAHVPRAVCNSVCLLALARKTRRESAARAASGAAETGRGGSRRWGAAT
jgi:hypothetical protein